MGVGSLVATWVFYFGISFLLFSLVISSTIVVMTFRQDKGPPTKAKADSSSLKRTSIDYPDDLSHRNALGRAWDRHLVIHGLPPFYTDDLSKVGPLLLGPDSVGKSYFEYEYDGYGHLNLTIKTVLPP